MKHILFIALTTILFNACGFDNSEPVQIDPVENPDSKQTRSDNDTRFWTKRLESPKELLPTNVILYEVEAKNLECYGLNAGECIKLPYCASMEEETCSDTRCDIDFAA